MKKIIGFVLGIQMSILVMITNLGCFHRAGKIQSSVNNEWHIIPDNAHIEEITAITMLDESKWWAVSSDFIFVTKNSGGAWDRIYEFSPQIVSGLRVSNRITAIQFLNENIGWLLGLNLMTTEDGGKNWIKVELYKNVNRSIPVPRSFYFIDENRGWAVGNILEGTDEKSTATVWETIDAGKHWREIKCFICDEHEVFWDLAVSKDGLIFVLGNLIYKLNPLNTKIEEVKVDLNTTSSKLIDIGIASQNVVWAEIADGSGYLISHDQGSNWTTIALGKPSDKIVFIDDKLVYMATGGDVLVSRDGGKNWGLDLQGNYQSLYLDRSRNIIAAIGQRIALKRLD